LLLSLTGKLFHIPEYSFSYFHQSSAHMSLVTPV
jgi:hypothetical protein